MGFGEFWLQSNNGKKFSFENLKELKKSDLNDNVALIKIFDLFNINGDEKLDKRELSNLFADIITTAHFGKGSNNSVFEVEEAEEYINTTYTQEGKTLKELGVKTQDLFDFLGALLQKNETEKSVSPENDIIPALQTNGKKKEPTQEELIQDFAADLLYNMLKQASDSIHEYYSNIGYLSGDAIWQGLKNIANFATFGNVETIWKEMDKIDEALAKAIKLKYASNSHEYKEIFKDLTGGTEFDLDKLQNLAVVTQKLAAGEIKNDSPEYTKAIDEAFGTKLETDQDVKKSVSKQSKAGSICSIIEMLSVLGVISKTAAVARFGEWAVSSLGTYGGSALAGAANLGGYTAVTEGINLISKEKTRENGISSDDLKQYGQEVAQSAGFGAMGGVWGNFAVSKVMGKTEQVIQKSFPKAAEKHMAKVTSKISDMFQASEGAAKTGADVMSVAAKTPGYVAQGAGFLTEVAGFTGYQVVVDTTVSMIQQGGVSLESIQNVLLQKAQMKGELTEEKAAKIQNMSWTEAILSLLLEENIEQFENLGTIKGVDAAMKFLMGSKVGMVADFNKYSSLKNMKVKPVTVEGKEVYEITDEHGNKLPLVNSDELVAFCNNQMQADILADMITKKMAEENKKAISESSKMNEVKQYTNEEIRANIDAIKQKGIENKRSNLDFVDHSNMQKYGINSYKDLINSELISKEEKAMIERIYNNAVQKGYKEFIDSNLDVLAGFAQGYKNVDGKLISLYENLSKEQLSVIKYAKDQLNNGLINEEYVKAIQDRINMSVPIEVYKYVDCPEQLPDKVYSSKNPQLYWTKEQCLEDIENIKLIKDFIDTQSIPNTVTVYRVQGYNVLKNVKIGDSNLADIMQKAIENGNTDDVIKMINESDITVYHENHIGTSLTSEQIFDGTYPIRWEIDVPAGSKGLFLESAVPEHAIYRETEFLLQMGSGFNIKNVEYKDGVWYIKADLVQERVGVNKGVNTGVNKGVNKDVETAKTTDAKKPERILTAEESKAIDDYTQKIRNYWHEKLTNGQTREDVVLADLKEAGFDKVGYDMGSRIKSESSLQDKMINYLKDNPEAGVDKAIKDVRDSFGARTKVKSGDFTKHPEVAALIKAGDIKGAKLRAAELQSQPVVEMLKEVIIAQANGTGKFKLTRITNYVSKEGIPYFSERQLTELDMLAKQNGIDIGFVTRQEADISGKKATTKSQPSGYTALQLNLETADGTVIEWQYRGELVNVFAEGEHIPYDLRTGKKLGAGNPELEKLYAPIEELLSKNNMSEATYKEYNRYLNDYYIHLRNLELGFESVEPKLSDYGNGYKFDSRLEASKLIELHEKAEAIKHK